MGLAKTLPILASILALSFFTTTNATIFDITNRCSYPVWAAALPGGGRRLNSGQVWQLDVGLSAPEATIWGRTKCNFNSSGHGQCETGGCNGALRCEGPGSPPTTLAKFSINERTLDYVILTLEQGFNIPIEISPTTNVCPNRRCSGPVREQCPRELRAAGGCNSACTVFGTNEYCCTDGNCGTTKYSRFFKERPIATLRMLRPALLLARRASATGLSSARDPPCFFN